DLIGQRSQPLAAARADDEVMSLGGKKTRSGFADAATGSGDKNDFGFCGSRHVSSPVCGFAMQPINHLRSDAPPCEYPYLCGYCLFLYLKMIFIDNSPPLMDNSYS